MGWTSSLPWEQGQAPISPWPATLVAWSVALCHCPHVSPALGKAYSLGRAEYGRLGLGEGAEEKSVPTLISKLPAVTSVACGASVGYAVTKDGEWSHLGSGCRNKAGDSTGLLLILRHG